jgi:aryl-alcohol dehydrogenase-like predicted oxidoreductase
LFKNEKNLNPLICIINRIQIVCTRHYLLTKEENINVNKCIRLTRLNRSEMQLENSISKMTLGTAQLGLNYGIANNEGKPGEEKALRILDSALASGVNCIDTAADYGDSEKIIGNLKEAGKYIITFKEIASDMNMSIPQLAITYEKSLKSVHSLVIGAENPFQAIENAKLVEFVSFNKATINEIEKRLAGAPVWLFMPFLWARQKN